MDRSDHPLFRFDRDLLLKEKIPRESCLVGVDESGRGPLAGPVLACAIVLSPDFYHESIDDSKKCSPSLRMKLSEKIKEKSFWAMGECDSYQIDSMNILQATLCAMQKALYKLFKEYPYLRPGLVIVDGIHIPKCGFPEKAIVQGDTKSASIASASILAKVERDHIMESFSKTYPKYGFEKHKGYGTLSHREKLKKFGPCPIHRRSFSPVQEMMS